MKKIILIIALVLLSSLTFAQKKEKVKGSKNVTIVSKEVDNFNAIEVEDNLELYLERGEKNEMRIEADDNLHEIIAFDVHDKTLRLHTTKETNIYKKLTVRLTYTSDLNKIIAKNDAKVYAIQELQLNQLTLSAFDAAKFYVNVNSKRFNLIMEDKSKTELNLKADDTFLQLSKSSNVKALVVTKSFKCDLYQKAIATIEGASEKAQIRLDNTSVFTGSKFNSNDIKLTAESSTLASVACDTTATLLISDKAEVSLYGEGKVTLDRFSEEAKLLKRK